MSPTNTNTHTSVERMASTQPPWVRCSPFNGTMFFLMVVGTNGGDDSRWSVILAALVGLLFTVWLRRRTACEKPPPPHACGTVEAWARGGYSVFENTMLVAGISAQLEREHKSWGPMSGIPLLVLSMIILLKEGQEQTKPEGGDWVTKTIGIFLKKIMFTRVAGMVLAGASMVLIFFSPSSGRSSMVRGEGMVYSFLIPLVLMTSTPVFSDDLLMSVLSGSWYVVMHMVLREVPMITSVFGLPLLVTSGLVLVGSFDDGWGTQLRFAWCMLSVFLGLMVASVQWGWYLRLGIAVVLGTVRIFFMVTDPYALQKKHLKTRYKLLQEQNEKIANQAIFRL